MPYSYSKKNLKLWYLTVQDLGLLLLLGLGLAGGVGGAGGVQGGLESQLVLLEVAIDLSDPLLDCKIILWMVRWFFIENKMFIIWMPLWCEIICIWAIYCSLLKLYNIYKKTHSYITSRIISAGIGRNHKTSHNTYTHILILHLHLTSYNWLAVASDFVHVV